MYVRGYLQGSENGRVVTIDGVLPLNMGTSRKEHMGTSRKERMGK